MFFENKCLYATKSEVDNFDPIPLGKGRIALEGEDLTIITYGRQVYTALDAAKKLAAEGIKAEVIDIRSLFPLDKDMIRESLEKTHKAIVITEETKRGGYGGEISATIAEEMFDLLDAPVARIGSLDTPVPFAPNLEAYYMPNDVDIVVAAKKMF
jgi:pyruvate dehydrogenase E1 component beta subunit